MRTSLPRCLLAAALLCSAAPLAAQAPAAGRSAVPIIDTHAHLARNRKSGPGGMASEALRILDAFNVERAVVLPPPYPYGHPGTYGRESLAPVVSAHPGRFALVAGGESLNGMLHDVAPGEVLPQFRERFLEEAEKIARSGAIGFGEIAVEHFSSGRGKHPYESTRPDHPLLLALADVAARHGMPIDLHMEAVPQDMEMPPRMRRGGNPGRLKENISGLERLLAHNRAARIVWAHCGWDLTGERTPPLMRQLLARHPNLYMSIKLDTNGPPRGSPFTPQGELRPGWLALFRDFPDRFMIGSDQFLDEGSERLARARALVDALPEALAAPIAHANARRIYRLK